MKQKISFLLVVFSLFITLSFAQTDPITLRLAIIDQQGTGRPNEPIALEFINQVKTLSEGKITIEPS